MKPYHLCPSGAAESLAAELVTRTESSKAEDVRSRLDMSALGRAGLCADTLESAMVVQIDADQPGGQELGSILRACGLTVLRGGLSCGIGDLPPLVMLAGNRNCPEVMARVRDLRQRHAAPYEIVVLPGPGTPSTDDRERSLVRGVTDVLRVAGLPFILALAES